MLTTKDPGLAPVVFDDGGLIVVRSVVKSGRPSCPDTRIQPSPVRSWGSLTGGIPALHRKGRVSDLSIVVLFGHSP